jgi:hypothetical protein
MPMLSTVGSRPTMRAERTPNAASDVRTAQVRRPSLATLRIALRG